MKIKVLFFKRPTFIFFIFGFVLVFSILTFQSQNLNFGIGINKAEALGIGEACTKTAQCDGSLNCKNGFCSNESCGSSITYPSSGYVQCNGGFECQGGSCVCTDPVDCGLDCPSGQVRCTIGTCVDDPNECGGCPQVAPCYCGAIGLEGCLQADPYGSIICPYENYSPAVCRQEGDINLTMLPISREIDQGGTTNFGVTISSVDGFSGTVNLSLSGCPADTICSLPSSANVPAGSYATLSLTISSTASSPTGSHTLNVTGTSGAVSDSDISWLTINPVTPSDPDIGISMSPDSDTITQGGSTTFDVTVSSIDGFAGTVNLSVSGCPGGGTSCSISPASTYLSSGDTDPATVTISNTSSSDTGAFSIGVTGSGGGESGSDTSQLTVNPGAPIGSCSSSSGYITRDYWTGISGNDVVDLTSDSDYPNNPSGTTEPTSFEAPVDWADSYGTRMYGLLEAPETGQYRFYISSDNASELWLSTDDTEANKSRIAYETTWSSYRSWQTGNEQSALINLTAGQKYFIEAIHKEGGGGDNLSVGWTKPSSGTIDIVPGSCLSPESAVSAPVVDLTASSASVYIFPGYTDSDGPLTIPYDHDISLTWTSTDATSCSISSSPNIGLWNGTAGSGVLVADINQNTTFTLNCTGPGGNSSDTLVVNIPPVPTNPSRSCSPAGDFVTFSWTNAPGYNTSYQRLYTPDASGASVANEEDYVGSSWIAAITPDTQHAWWMHTKDTSNNSWSNAIGESFSCASTPSCNAPSSGDGILASIYNGTNFNTLTNQHVDAIIDFNPADSIGSTYAGGGDTFSVRWEGEIEARCGGAHTFYTQSDDGVRLWIDGTQIINNWTNHASTENTGTINLTAGVRYPIRMDYYEDGGGAVARLSWSATGLAKEIVPQSQLFSADADPTVNISTVPSTIAQGESTTISWSTTDADSCTASGDWSGSRAVSGSESSGALSADSTFILNCAGPGGTASDSATVTVNPPSQPTPDVSADITAVNGSGSFSLSDIKDGDTLSITINFANSGPGDTSQISSGISLSSNLTAPANFSCPSCVGTYDNFIYTIPLASGEDFDVTFDVTVATQTQQPKELIIIDAAGTYDPGSSPFTARIILLATPEGVITPDFTEVPPGS